MRNARARELLRHIPYAAIATTNGTRPWNTPAVVGYDKDWNFYWTSSRDAVHSQNVRATGRAFLVIFNSATFLSSGPSTGIYLDCTAIELSETEDVQLGMEALMAGMRLTEPAPVDDAVGSSPFRLYRGTPEKVWMNDKTEIDGVIHDTRAELDLRRIHEPD